jgi:hypothetical protein
MRGVTVKSKASPGESYYKNGGNWKDLHNYWFSNLDYQGTANFCIKALTNPWTPTGADLHCNDEISWTDARPLSIIKDSFTIRNIGEPSSNLNWEIAEWPEWGRWTFTPSSGDNLKPETGEVTIGISLITPLELGAQFSGQIKVVNKDNPNDFGIVEISLKTIKNRESSTIFDNLLDRIIERFLKNNYYFYENLYSIYSILINTRG